MDHQARIKSVEQKQELYAFDDAESDSEEDEDDDLVDFMREFTKVHALSRTAQFSANILIKYTELIGDLHDKFYDGLDTTQQGQVAPMWHELYERLCLLQAQVRVNQEHILSNQAEIQMATQTVWQATNICQTLAPCENFFMH